MNEYSKTVGIKFEVNKDSFNKAKEAMTDAAKASNKEWQKEWVDSLEDLVKDKSIPKQFRKDFKEQLKELKKDIRDEKFEDTFGDFSKGFKEGINPAGKEFSWKNAGEEFASSLDTVFTKAKDALANVLKDAWSELGNILQYSLLSNKNTRDLAFNYGFSGSQAYGYSKAMSIMGLQDEEDLMYLNPQQREKFFDSMSHFTEKYDSLYDSGFFEEYLDFQYEMAEFKEDIKLEVVQFFMNNKDLIKSGMKAIMTLAEGALKALTQIVKFLGLDSRDASDRVATSTDIINSYANNSRTTDVKIDNTFNNVAKQDQGWLVNAGMKVTEQIVQAFN